MTTFFNLPTKYVVRDMSSSTLARIVHVNNLQCLTLHKICSAPTIPVMFQLRVVLRLRREKCL